MRYALVMVLLGTVLASSAWSVAAQSADEDVSPDAAQAADPAAPDVSQPEATPLVVYLVVTATPAPTIETTPTPVIYNTRKGPRSESDLRTELTSAGYGGPWDVASLLAAYDRATTPTSTPAPTWTPIPAPRQPSPDPVLTSRCFQFAFEFVTSTATYASPKTDFGGLLQAFQNGCIHAATEAGVAGEQCYEFAVRQWFQGNLNTVGGVSPNLIDTLYRACLGR